MNRDQKLAQVLVEFAHTLGTDFSIQDILERLVDRVVEVLPVTAAGVMVMRQDEDLHFLAASDDTIHEIEALQNKFKEGPCLEAYRTGQAVAVPDLRVDRRFPLFSPRALSAGLAAVFTFPLRINDQPLGALDLYRDLSGVLSAGDMRAAQVLADVAAAYLFNAQSRRDAEDHLVQLRHRNLHDPLTGLANRTLFAELLEHAVARARRTHLQVAVLFVDLDRFKAVNDEYGHHFGDLVLMAVATRLTAVLRPGDTLARLSGDEFVILCQDLPGPEQAELVATRIASALVDPISVDGGRVDVTASVGIAFSGHGQDVPEVLLRDADFAMYQAKGAGGGHHRVVDRPARIAADHRTHLESDLRDALTRQEFQLAYQPIARAAAGRLVGVEALLRWERPGHGMVPPDVIIPIAERTGMIVALGDWVLHQACTDFVRWRGSYPDALSHVAVNVSADQVMGSAFVGSVAAVLAHTGIEPACLHLEVTESVFLADAQRARAVLVDLTSLGVRLSLDDFGTGYSSLTYLKRLPFDVLKIDRSFVADLTLKEPGTDSGGGRDFNDATRAIVASVIDLAHALDMTVVAEGVETRQQLDQIIDMGGDLAQGYLLGRPLFGSDLERQVLGPAQTVPEFRLPPTTA